MNQDTKNLFLETLSNETGECEVCNPTTQSDPALLKSLPKPDPKRSNIYKGIRDGKGPRVLINGQPLATLGYFDWGHCGGACKNLAQKILTYEYGSTKALAYYLDFTYNTICNLPEKEWTLTSDDIAQALVDIDRHNKGRVTEWTPNKTLN